MVIGNIGRNVHQAEYLVSTLLMSLWLAYPVFEFIGVLVLLLIQVNEVVGDSVKVSNIHGPGDPKRVTCDVVDFNAVWGGQQLHDPTSSAPRIGKDRNDKRRHEEK